MILRTHIIQAINPDELKLTITIKQNYLTQVIKTKTEQPIELETHHNIK